MTADDLLAHWPHCRHTIKGSMETKPEQCSNDALPEQAKTEEDRCP